METYAKKKCSNCSRAEQSVSEFINAKGIECNTCNKCREKGKKHDKTQKKRDAHNKLQSENKRLDSIKRSAEKREISWELDDEVAKEMITKPCVYCGHLDITVRVNGIDRMDSFGYYSIDNCVPCCKGCNFMKNVITIL